MTRRLALALLLLAAPAWADDVTVIAPGGGQVLAVAWSDYPGVWVTFYGEYGQNRMLTVHMMDQRTVAVGWWFTDKPTGPCHVAWTCDLAGRQFLQACDPWDDTDVKVFKIGGRK